MSQNKVICPVCPHACALTEGQVGICGARQACGGKVIDQNYGRLASVALDPDITYHITRFFPCHKLTDREPTEVALIHQLVEIARTHLNYVYPGNC